MNTNEKRSFYCVFAALCFFPLILAQAQIQTDGSLGSAQKLNGPNYTIDEGLGQRAGNNLFHSFSEFNINKGESATFRGANEIANVISRVTGGKLSTIDGLLKSEIKNANVYLINSSGVLFGPNASLSINGSFHASTADYMSFGREDLFYSKPLRGEILSTAAPAAFGFFGLPQSNITVAGSQLSLEDGATFSLVGADITIENEANVHIPRGQINLVGVSSAGEAFFDVSRTYRDLDVSAFTGLSDVNILSDSELNVDGESGGRIVIRGGRMVLEESLVSAKTTGRENGKGIDIAVDQFRFKRSKIDTTTTESGTAGDVLIVANTLVLDGFHYPEDVGIFANSADPDSPNATQNRLASGKAGAVTITADQIDVLGEVPIETTSIIPEDTGTIDLSSPQLTLNGFTANFQVNSGKGEFMRLAGGSIVLDGSFNPDWDGRIVDFDGTTHEIEANQGEIAEKNLFYSFRHFVVDEGETVLFQKSEQTENVSNIIIRITGDHITSIYGELESQIPGVNLYLINPNGVFFGPNLESNLPLRLPGSFHIGTADYLTLTDGGRFDVSNPARSVLNSGELSAYGFTDNEIGEITLERSNFLLSESVSSLIGGNLWLEGAQLFAPFGHINLISLKAAGEVFISDGSNDLDVSHFSTFGDIIIDDNGGLSVTDEEGPNALPNFNPVGRIFVRGNDLRLDNGGMFAARNRTVEGAGGSIDVNISGDLFIGKNSRMAIDGEGELGQIAITAENFTINGLGQGENGFTGINASQIGKASSSESGFKVAVAQNLNIINEGVILLSNYSDANSDVAIIEAQDLVIDGIIDGDPTGILYFSNAGSGNAGELYINVDEHLQILDGGLIDTSTFSSGNAGSVTVQAKNLTIDGRDFGFASIRSIAGEDSNGNGGNLDVKVTEHLQVLDGGMINASTFGSGNAGSVTVQAKNLTIDGRDFGFAGIGSIAGEDSNGNGGNLDIKVTEHLEMINDGEMSAFANKGNAGNLNISAEGNIYIIDSYLSISAGQEDFDVNGLNSFSKPELSIKAGNSIYIQDSILSTNAGVLGSGRGSGGDIYLHAPLEIWLENSTLLAQAGYSGGNVYIDPIRYIVISSDVIAQADVQGGNYNVIVTKPSGWIQSRDSQINLSGRQSGSVLSNTSPFDLGAELSDLNLDFLNLKDWVSQPCKFRLAGTGSSFVVTGWRGVSNNIDDFLPSEPILLTDYIFSETETIDKTILQKEIFPDLKNECEDCP